MKRILLLLATVLPVSAHAHAGAAGISGFLHPFSGLDHVLAMLVLGLWAAKCGGRALPVLPGAAVVMLAVGGYAGASGHSAPFVEHGIVVSVIVLALLVAAPDRFSLGTKAAVVGFFAFFHGIAHGVEMPAEASGLAYGAGFMLASVFLNGVGVAISCLARRYRVRFGYPAG